jgi:hypothetical protein
MEIEKNPDRFRELKPKFVISFGFSGAILFAYTIVIALSYGASSLLKFEFGARLAIGVVAFLA